MCRGLLAPVPHHTGGALHHLNIRTGKYGNSIQNPEHFAGNSVADPNPVPFWPWNLLSLVHKITNVPVVYMGLDVWIWMGEKSISRGVWRGWALKSRLFFAQMALATLVPISGLKKVSILGLAPSNASRYGLLPHPYPYVPPHINNRYINSYNPKTL